MNTGVKYDHVGGALSVVVLSITIQQNIEFMMYFVYLSLTYLVHKG